MGLDRLVRSVVKIADKVTGSLQDNVTHHPWIGQNQHGEAVYGEGVSISCLIEYKQVLRRQPNKQDVISNAQLCVLTPMTENGAAGRREPVDPRDKFVLPDGTTGWVVDYSGGLEDPSTAYPYLHKIYLG